LVGLGSEPIGIEQGVQNIVHGSFLRCADYFDDKNGNIFVLRYYYGTKDSRFGEHHVIAFLANTNKTFSFKNTRK
jgi:hypothetical protein